MQVKNVMTCKRVIEKCAISGTNPKFFPTNFLAGKKECDFWDKFFTGKKECYFWDINCPRNSTPYTTNASQWVSLSLWI